jgi:squamous cell carcinoma antigen recognized by T-cells 3
MFIVVVGSSDGPSVPSGPSSLMCPLPLAATLKMDEEQALEALSNVISALSETPFDLSLHVKHIQLAVAAGMDDQVREARDTLTAYYACGDDVWLPLIEDKKSAADLDTVDGTLFVLTAYKRAEDDYLCTHLLY